MREEPRLRRSFSLDRLAASSRCLYEKQAEPEPGGEHNGYRDKTARCHRQH